MSQIETGQILVKEKGNISLVDNKSGNVLWKNTIDTDKDPLFLNDLPIMYFSGKSYAIIDAVTGNVLDKSSISTEILNIHYFWDLKRVVLELNRENNLYITNIDLANLDASWSTKIGEIRKSLFGLVASSTQNTPSITKDGTLILVDKKVVTTVDSKGKVKERIEFKENLEKLGFNGYNNFLYVREEKKLHFINTVSGKIESTKEIEDEDFSFNILDLGNVVSLRDGKKLQFLNSTNGTDIVNKKFDDKIKSTYYDNITDKFYLSIKKSVVELNQKNAEPVRQADFPRSMGSMYKLDNKIFIFDDSETNELDLSTLKLKYSKPIPIYKVEKFLTEGELTLYVSDAIKTFKFIMVDGTGKKLWDKEFNSAYAPTIDFTKAGLLIISSDELLLLDPKTGKSTLKTDIKTGPTFVHHINEATNKLTMYSDKKIKTLDLNTGAYGECKKEIEFKDFDYEKQQPYIAVTDDLIYLKGSNSVFITDKSGLIKYEKHYKITNNTSGLLSLAVLAVGVGSIASGNADKVVSVYSGGQEIHRGAYVDGLNNVGNYANSLEEKRRREQNRGSAIYPYVYTKLESGKRGLIFIDQNTGKHKFEVVMEESDPKYVVDEIDGILFYINGGKLSAFQLK